MRRTRCDERVSFDLHLGEKAPNLLDFKTLVCSLAVNRFLFGWLFPLAILGPQSFRFLTVKLRIEVLGILPQIVVEISLW